MCCIIFEIMLGKFQSILRWLTFQLLRSIYLLIRMVNPTFVVWARLPNKPNMGGQNSLMSLVLCSPYLKHKHHSANECLVRYLFAKMNDTFLSKREKWKVNHVHPYIRRATYDVNVVKNQELLQVCDHFFSFYKPDVWFSCE